MNAAQAESLGQRFVQALRYPLYESALISQFILLAARLGASLLPLFGRPLHFFVWLGVYQFAYEALAATANGRRLPPDVPGLVESALSKRHTWLQALILVGVVAIASKLGAIAATLAAVAVGVALPAMLIVLTVERNVLQAINPLQWLSTARGLGLQYAALVPLGVGATLVQANAAELIPTWLPRSLAIVAYYGLAHFLVIAAFHMVGRTLFVNRDLFGFEADAPDAALVPPAQLRDERLLADFERRIGAGESQAVERELRDLVGAGAAPALNECYRALLEQRGDRTALVAHARTWVAQLLTTGQERQALAIAAESIADDPAFLPADPDDTARLVAAAERMSLIALAAALAANYVRAFPKRRDAIVLAVKAARLLGGRLDRSAEARALLTRMLDFAQNDAERIELGRALAAL